MNFSNEKIVGKVIEVNNDDILPNRFQPRKYFDEEETLELAESIKEHGILQPIVVRQVGDKYEIIAGERRYKANILAGNDTIPAIVSNLNDKESSEIAVIENIQRQDLTPIEEAISYCDKNSVVVIGTRDKAYELYKNHCDENMIKAMYVSGANHSLEVEGQPYESIDVLKRVMRFIER